MKADINILLAAPYTKDVVALLEALQSEGYQLRHPQTYTDISRLLKKEFYDLILLDLQNEGLERLDAIRQLNPTKRVWMMDTRCAENDQCQAYQMGASDFLSYKLPKKVLLAKIANAVWRNPVLRKSAIYQLGRCRYDAALQCILPPEGARKQLSSFQAEVLECLLERPGRLLTREEIQERVWKGVDYFKGRSMDVIIHQLRAILRIDPQVSIQTYWGRGYMLEANVEQIVAA